MLEIQWPENEIMLAHFSFGLFWSQLATGAVPSESIALSLALTAVKYAK